MKKDTPLPQSGNAADARGPYDPLVRLDVLTSGATAAVLAVGAVAMLTAGGRPLSDLQPELGAVLARDLHFSPDDLVDLQHGKIVKHTLPPAAPEEIGVVGAVRIQGSRDRLIAEYRDILMFKKSDGVLEIGRFSDPPDS